MIIQAMRKMVKIVKDRVKCPYCGKIKNNGKICRICGCAGQIEEFGLYIMQTK